MWEFTTAYPTPHQNVWVLWGGPWAPPVWSSAVANAGTLVWYHAGCEASLKGLQLLSYTLRGIGHTSNGFPEIILEISVALTLGLSASVRQGAWECLFTPSASLCGILSHIPPPTPKGGSQSSHPSLFGIPNKATTITSVSSTQLWQIKSTLLLGYCVSL